jgi:hypothetical protein
MTHSVYRYGQRVLIGPETGKIQATVLACEFRGPDFGKLIYLVSWWSDADHKSEWMDAIEVEAVDEDEPRAVFTINARAAK